MLRYCQERDIHQKQIQDNLLVAISIGDKQAKKGWDQIVTTIKMQVRCCLPQYLQNRCKNLLLIVQEKVPHFVIL